MMKFSKHILIFILCLFAQNELTAQNLIQNDKFKYVPKYNGSAVLIREIPLTDISVAAQNFNKLKYWIKKTYTTDLINSSIRYYESEKRVNVRSKVELLLPLLNRDNISEKAVMDYTLNAFIRNGKCILEISEIQYKMQNTMPPIKKKVKAEDLVTPEALQILDEYSSQRSETQKGTLYFFNNLADDLARDLSESIRK